MIKHCKTFRSLRLDVDQTYLLTFGHSRQHQHVLSEQCLIVFDMSRWIFRYFVPCVALSSLDWLEIIVLSYLPLLRSLNTFISSDTLEVYLKGKTETEL